MDDEILTADEKVTISLELLKAMQNGELTSEEYDNEIQLLKEVREW